MDDKKTEPVASKKRIRKPAPKKVKAAEADASSMPATSYRTHLGGVVHDNYLKQ